MTGCLAVCAAIIPVKSHNLHLITCCLSRDWAATRREKPMNGTNYYAVLSGQGGGK